MGLGFCVRVFLFLPCVCLSGSSTPQKAVWGPIAWPYLTQCVLFPASPETENQQGANESSPLRHSRSRMLPWARLLRHEISRDPQMQGSHGVLLALSPMHPRPATTRRKPMDNTTPSPTPNPNRVHGRYPGRTHGKPHSPCASWGQSIRDGMLFPMSFFLGAARDGGVCIERRATGIPWGPCIRGP